jgi:phosphatidylglycerol:prolipoprotein diacylglycerol transferase
MALLSFFHLYGFLIGIGVWLTILLAERKASVAGISTAFFWKVSGWVIIGSLIGARLYHVITDFNLYQNNLIGMFQVWRGGLSIIGAIIGGVISLFLYLKIKKEKWGVFWKFADIVVFGAPFGQAIGRFGNYFNQELYGLPSYLPWSIYIDPTHRFASFQDQATYHPLFLYEVILLLMFGIFIWKFGKTADVFLKIGSGRIFLLYIWYYSLIRFCLDFLRIDKTFLVINSVEIGVNQLFLLFIWIVTGSVLLMQYRKYTHAKIK